MSISGDMNSTDAAATAAVAAAAAAAVAAVFHIAETYDVSDCYIIFLQQKDEIHRRHCLG